MMFCEVSSQMEQLFISIAVSRDNLCIAIEKELAVRVLKPCSAVSLAWESLAKLLQSRDRFK